LTNSRQMGKLVILPSALVYFSIGVMWILRTLTLSVFLILCTALKIGFFDLKKALLLNNGSLKLNPTSLSSVAGAIITILSNPNLIKNRCALIHDLFISQNDALKVVEEELGPNSRSVISAPRISNDNPKLCWPLVSGDSTAYQGCHLRVGQSLRMGR
jgi:hypothetical protein